MSTRDDRHPGQILPLAGNDTREIRIGLPGDRLCDPIEIDDLPPSPIDSDQPASLHGVAIHRGCELVTTRERARELFGRGTELGERCPLPFQLAKPRGKR